MRKTEDGEWPVTVAASAEEGHEAALHGEPQHPRHVEQDGLQGEGDGALHSDPHHGEEEDGDPLVVGVVEDGRVGHPPAAVPLDTRLQPTALRQKYVSVLVRPSYKS